jgi:hypothetical protein
MEATAEFGDENSGSRAWPVITLGLLATAWLTFFLTLGYANRLAERWGPAPDVVDALALHSYVGGRTWPYYSATLFLDLLAIGSLTARSRRGWPRALKVMVGVLLVPSVFVHGLAWLFGWFFAA